jgi:raffinose/stachyose/melibiose transport system permease protein
MKKLTVGKGLFGFFALLFAFVFLYPIYFTVISSFKDNNEIWNTMFALPRTLMTDNFASAIGKIGILTSVMNSFIYSLGATGVVVVVVTMGAYVIARRLLPGMGALKMYYLLGLMLPAYAMLIPMVKIFNTFSLNDNYPAMILLYAAINFPMSFYLISGYVEGLSREIDEAAIVDGCGTMGIVFRIIFPIAKPGIFTAAIISFLAVYNELIFANTLLFQKTRQTISVTLLGLQGERFNSWGPMFASIVLSIIPILVIYLLFQEKIQGGTAAGAVKG